MGYPYFAASLAMQRFGEPPVMTVAAFREDGMRLMSARDAAGLAALLDGAESTHPWVRAWQDAETQLRNAIARARAARTSAGAEAAARWTRSHGGWRCDIEGGVAAAFAESDPWKRTRALAKVRWDLADELAGLDSFSAGALYAYAIHLEIAAQLAAADAEKGAARLRRTAEATGQK